MDINRIAILGAGAVGASLAHQLLKENPSQNITIIAEGPRSERYRREGLTVNEDVIRPGVSDGEPHDLVFLATKSYHLDQALPLLDRCVGPDTLIMSLLNGIASETQLGNRYGDDHVVPAMILGIDAVRENGVVRYMNNGVIHFGENPRVSDLVKWFEASGLGFEVSDNITRTLWRKFMINVGANQVSAALGAPYARLREDPLALKLMRGAMEEVVGLSRLEGTGLTDKDIDDWNHILETLDPAGKTSMLQDAEAGRRMELDLFADTVIALAEKHGIETPVNRELKEILEGLSAEIQEKN
jgi:2-dehydropantoate 2-reductase